MKKEEDSLPEEPDKMDFTKLAIATVAGVLILSGAVYAAYRYSQKQAGNIILPGGVTYLGPSPNQPQEAQQPPTAPLRFSAPSTVTWATQYGKIYPYSFSYPSTLPLVIFPGDQSDSFAIVWGNIPAQQNLLVNIEFIDKRDPNLLGKPKQEYVTNWYKFFSGLKGVAKVEPFTNVSGLKGYKASFTNWTNTSPNTDIFFEIPNKPEIMLHLANGILEPAIFDRMVDSVKWITPTPKAKATATP